MYYVGERGFPYTETHIDGDIESGKYVIYFFHSGEVLGFFNCWISELTLVFKGSHEIAYHALIRIASKY
jgi:hypothetical protein